MLSIIIPVYNSEPYIGRMVESVLRQTWQDFELLLVDDGSTDGSLDVCHTLAEGDARIHVLTKENGGVSSARNCGLAEARGDFIAFLDDDDVIDERMYGVLLAAFDDEKTDVACCSIVREAQYRPLPYREAVPVVSESPRELFLIPDCFMTSALNKVYRRSVIGDTRFDETVAYAEDKLFVAQIFGKARRAVFIDHPFYHYIARGDSLSWQDDAAVWEGNFRVQAAIYQKMRRDGVEENLLRWAFTEFVKAVFALLRYDVKYRKKDAYQKTVATYRKDIARFFKETPLPFGKWLEYRTYAASWPVASLFHYYTKRRR